MPQIKCKECGHVARFAVRSSRYTANKRLKVQYLRCGVCGARARRVVEVVCPPE
jgi:transcription elongation factor Elf1